MLIALILTIGQRLRQQLPPSKTTDRGLVYFTGDFWSDFGHQAIRDFPFLSASPFKLLAVLCCYLYLVAVICAKRTRSQTSTTTIPVGPVTFSRRVPAILLLNGSQLGLNGAWFLLGLFLSPLGQNYTNPDADTKTVEFIEQLRIYFCCSFLLFKLVTLYVHVILLLLTKRRRVTKLELFENVTLPLLVYLSAKFGHFNYLLVVSLINTAVSFFNCSYLTLASAKVVGSYPSVYWERTILVLKCLQYSAIYSYGLFVLSTDRSALLTNLLVNIFTMTYSSIMNFAVYCSLVEQYENSI